MMDGQNDMQSSVGDVITDLVLTIFKTNGRLLRVGDKMVRDLKLTSARWQVLGAVDRQPRTAAQIAREYELSRQGVLFVVQAMVKEGLIELVHNPDHRRAKLVQLTEQGRQTTERVKALQRVWADGVGSMFSIEELNTAIDLLQRLGAAAVTGDEQDDD